MLHPSVRDALTLRTADTLRAIEALERCAALTAAENAREIAECLRLIENTAHAARERITIRSTATSN